MSKVQERVALRWCKPSALGQGDGDDGPSTDAGVRLEAVDRPCRPDPTDRGSSSRSPLGRPGQGHDNSLSFPIVAPFCRES